MSPSYDHNTFQQQFARFDLSFSQAAMQSYLAEVYHDSGLRGVLDLLWEWEHRVGYFNLGSLKENRRFHYFDEATQVTYRAQINFARNKYSPQPANVSNLPPVHCAPHSTMWPAMVPAASRFQSVSFQPKR